MDPAPNSYRWPRIVAQWDVSMKRFALVCSLAVFAQASFAGNAIEIDVTPSMAPNAFGSPNWGTYRDNAIAALENNETAHGTPGTASYYESFSSGPASYNVVTGFDSWLGQAPGTYTGENGNRAHFGLHAIGHGQQFSLSDVSYDMEGTDPDNVLKFVGSFDGTDQYTASRVGLSYGADHIKGTGDDIIYNGGESATNLVDELFYVGVGNAIDVYDSDPGATEQDKINNMLASTGLAGGYDLTTTYSIQGSQGSATAHFTPVPEPASMAALGLGFLGFIRKRRKK
jgi:hypothetical protein